MAMTVGNFNDVVFSEAVKTKKNSMKKRVVRRTMMVKALEKSNGVSSLLRDLLNPEIEEEEALIRPKNGLGEYAKVDPCPSSSSDSFCI